MFCNLELITSHWQHLMNCLIYSNDNVDQQSQTDLFFLFEETWLCCGNKCNTATQRTFPAWSVLNCFFESCFGISINTYHEFEFFFIYNSEYINISICNWIHTVIHFYYFKLPCSCKWNPSLYFHHCIFTVTFSKSSKNDWAFCSFLYYCLPLISMVTSPFPNRTLIEFLPWQVTLV